MQLFKHILRLRSGPRPCWEGHQWRLLLVLLVVLCIGVEPITSGCQTAGPGLLLYQPVGQQAHAPAPQSALAPQPGVNLVWSAATASDATAPASTCFYIVGGRPIGATAPISLLDKLLVSAGLMLVGAMLVRPVRLDAPLRPPQIRYPPPTPPPIAIAS